MDEKLAVEIISEGHIGVVVFKATSLSNSEGIAVASEQIREFIEKSHPEKLIFDFGGVKFFSSQVLGLLLEVRAKVQAYKGEVVISAIEPQLHRIFRITNLDKIFNFFPDRESAVKSMSPN
jgi:anti-sigma B factor antagonist